MPLGIVSARVCAWPDLAIFKELDRLDDKHVFEAGQAGGQTAAAGIEIVG